LISFAMTAEDARGMRYTSAKRRGYKRQYVNLERQTYHHTVASSMGSRPCAYPPIVCAASPREHLLQILNTHFTCGKLHIPASRFIPSRPASTHDALQTPQTSLSFPSLTHPQLAAASASMAGGLLAYVLSLYVARRSSRLCMDDGRYSYDAVEPELRGVVTRNLAGSALRVFAAVRARMAAR
jgi:hypothetical protein